MEQQDSTKNGSHTLRSFRNDPEDFLPEALGGFVASHPDAEWDSHGFIHRASAVRTTDGGPAVGVVSGGGSGHEPLHAGFLGAGLLSAVCPGHLFTSPNAVQVTEATRWADQGKGVVHVVKNYTGDVMNFAVARQALNDVDTREVLVADDVATDSADEGGPGRRGTGATIVVEKVVGAAAAAGFDLDDVAELGQWVADHSRSMAVSLAPGHLPTTGRDTFDLPDGKMEVGVGIHGERGVDRVAVETADAVVDRLLDGVLAQLPDSDEVEACQGAGDENSGDGVIVVVNGLGGTPPLELSLVFGTVLQELSRRGVAVARGLVGSYVTSVTMAGVSVTLTRATPRVLELFDAPTEAPAWPRIVAGATGHEPAFAPARTEFDDSLPQGGENNQWLSDFIERVQGATEDLTELDRLAGDGDFGQNMDAAFGTLELPLTGSDSDVLHVLSQRMLIRAGGTSGAVFGTLFRELAEAAKDEDPAAVLREGLAQAQRAVTRLGGAEEGDRTLVDALAPAARAAAEAPEDVDVAELLDRCFEAASEGAKNTAELVAKKGRASYLGDSARGVVDPGTIVVSWLFGGTGEVSEFTG